MSTADPPEDGSCPDPRPSNDKDSQDAGDDLPDDAPDDAPEDAPDDGPDDGPDGSSFYSEDYDDDESSYNSDEWYDELDERAPPEPSETLASHPREIEQRVVFSEPSIMVPVQASMEAAFETPSVAGLGDLQRFPVEILMMILRQMDIHTFFRFRQVNLRARELSAAIPEYKTIAKHALGAIRALLRARLAQVTVNDLYQELQTDRCEACDEFGGLLSLFTAKRCCFRCLLDSPQYRVLGLGDFCKSAGVTRKTVRHHPTLRTVPGQYDEQLMFSLFSGTRPSRLVLVGKTTTALFNAGVIDEPTREMLEWRQGEKEHRAMTATPFPSYDPKTDKLDRGVYCDACRYYLEEFGGEDDPYYGWSYEDELDEFRWEEHVDVFSKDEFDSHYEECEGAQELWMDMLMN